MMPALPAIKEQLATIISSLPEKATWDDVLYEIYVRQSVEQGLADVAAGRTIPAEEVEDYLKKRIAQRAGSLEQ
jgi:predicted transcriptional regulator